MIEITLHHKPNKFEEDELEYRYTQAGIVSCPREVSDTFSMSYEHTDRLARFIHKHVWPRMLGVASSEASIEFRVTGAMQYILSVASDLLKLVYAEEEAAPADYIRQFKYDADEGGMHVWAEGPKNQFGYVTRIVVYFDGYDLEYPYIYLTYDKQ